MTGTNGANGSNGATIGTAKVKQGLAQMLKGGVIVSSRVCCILTRPYAPLFCGCGFMAWTLSFAKRTIRLSRIL